MPEGILDLIKLDKKDYKLLSHEHQVYNDSGLWEIKADWECFRINGSEICLSGKDDQGRVNATSRYKC